MKISCVIVSYNNGTLLEEAVMSIVEQTRPLDEIIVADDCSTDGSRELIRSLSRRYPSIKPVFRERNIGVSANRDLAMREACGDYVTFLDGDDHFLPTKIEAEERALLERPGGIAYSDLRIVDRSTNRSQTLAMADFSRLSASERFRWVLTRPMWIPMAMLIPKHAHLRIGGYNHSLRNYEDWEYLLRLAAQPLQWVHSGTEGSVVHPGGGLSRIGSLAHMRAELRVLRLQHRMARRCVGWPVLLTVAARIIAFRSKWGMLEWYRRKGG